MTPTEIFHGKFCSQIRVAFNWRKFFIEDSPIEVVTLSDVRIFGNLKLPWYLNSSSEFVGYGVAGALPVVLGDVSKWIAHLPSDRRESIEKMRDEVLSGVRSTEFEFPSYAIPQCQYLILDGNHRLCALALSGLPFRVQMYVLKGPLDPVALPDLLHYV